MNRQRLWVIGLGVMVGTVGYAMSSRLARTVARDAVPSAGAEHHHHEGGRR